MTNERNIEEQLGALADMLDVYGADRGRWPVGLEQRVSGLVASNARARRLVAEAAALDQVLNWEAMMSPACHQAVSARIFAAAGLTDNVSARPHVVDRPNVRPYSPGAVALRQSQIWQTGALLAASLVLGIFAGASSTFGPTVTHLTDVAGLNTTADAGSINELDVLDDGDIEPEEDV